MAYQFLSLKEYLYPLDKTFTLFVSIEVIVGLALFIPQLQKFFSIYLY